jgi:signal transduction histidine kinase
MTAMATTMAGREAQEFDRIINDIERTQELSSRSSTKFLSLERWLAGLFPSGRLMPRVKYVSAEKQIGNRLGEAAGKMPTFTVLLLAPSIRQSTVRRALSRRIGSSAATARQDEGGTWKIDYVLEDPKYPIAERLRSIFPELVVEHVASQDVVKAQEEQLWRDISSAAAHKIGNPVFAIETNLESLKVRLEKAHVQLTEALDVVTEVGASLERAKVILREFRSLTLATEVQPAKIDICELLEHVEKEAVARGFRCRVECPPGIVVDGDREKLSQCFDELLSNAWHWVKRIDKELEIRVRTPVPPEAGVAPDDEYVHIRVKDNGPGVPARIKEEIFQRSYSQREMGTGFGLMFVRFVIEAHHGLVYEDGNESEGAAFNLILPLFDEDSEKGGGE